MARSFVSHGELVTTARREGFPVDATVPTEVLELLLGGARVDPETPTPVLDAAVEMQEFVQEHRHILNIDCDGICLECPDVIAATCYQQLPTVREEIHEKDLDEKLK